MYLWNAKNFHVSHIRTQVIESLMHYVSHLLTYTVCCLKIIKQMYFLHINVEYVKKYIISSTAQF